MSEFFGKIFQELSQGRDICLATIVRQVGSAPRSLGTSFFVRRDGSSEGTIGGGRLEHDVIRAAREALQEDKARLMPFRLKGEDVADSEMLCGGDVDVYLEPLSNAEVVFRQIYQAAAQLAGSGGRGLLATAVAPGPMGEVPVRKLLLRERDRPVGVREADAPLAEMLTERLVPLLDGSRTELLGTPAGDFFLEPVCGQPVVFLFGGGHISRYLADQVTGVGFRLVVIDDRREYANSERFPRADEIWVHDFRSVLDRVNLGPEAYVVIVTRGHVYDKDVLAQALKQKPAYVGMIGSRRKRDIIFQALEREGFGRDVLSAVHSPIGMDIGAQTPEEIAVSIVAELVAVRAGRLPRWPGRAQQVEIG